MQSPEAALAAFRDCKRSSNGHLCKHDVHFPRRHTNREMRRHKMTEMPDMPPHLSHIISGL